MNHAEPAEAVPVQHDPDVFLCGVCGLDHHTIVVQCDYEPCAECGFDHAYEYAEAMAWHREEDRKRTRLSGLFAGPPVTETYQGWTKTAKDWRGEF